jgi:serine/threonine protein phosphatase 1
MQLQHHRHVHLDLSDRRRVLLVADVHGQYHLLEEALSNRSWDPAQDALIIVGDLADRGADSEAAIEWTGREGVHRVLGNHDVMPRMLLDGEQPRKTLIRWGGAWFVDLPDERLREIADAFEAAPVAMTVVTPGGYRIGIVHGDCGDDWGRHVELLSSPAMLGHRACVELSLWSKETALNVLQSHQRLGCGPERVWCQVEGIDHVFHGHTPVENPFAHCNRSWIDTHAYDPAGRLTVIDADAWLDDVDMHRTFV